MGSGGQSVGTIVLAGGIQIVAGGGVATGTRVSGGGVENVSAGTIVDTTILSGGTLTLSYSAKVGQGLVVASGGKVEVGYLATLNGFTASNGVTLTLGVFGSAGQTVLDGGTEVIDGGDAEGTVTFLGGHSTLVENKGAFTTSSVTGFSKGDRIVLKAFAFHPSETLSFSENAGKTQGVLTITDGLLSTKITLLGQYIAAGFHLAAKAGGGTAITYSDAPAIEAVLASHMK
jgi:autotransporter passenger strand-loop-strand repeat protein